MAANAEGLEWRQARQYLIHSGVIPPTHRVTKPDVDLVDFARSLRDGVFLCSLLNKMKPDCVEDWSPRPLMQVCVKVGGRMVNGRDRHHRKLAIKYCVYLLPYCTGESVCTLVVCVSPGAHQLP